MDKIRNQCFEMPAPAVRSDALSASQISIALLSSKSLDDDPGILNVAPVNLSTIDQVVVSVVVRSTEYRR